MVTQGSDIKMVFNIADTNEGIYDLVDASVSVRIIKPSKSIDEIFCTIIDESSAKAEVYLDKTNLNECGNYLFQLVVRKGNSVNKSPLNGFYVGGSVGDLV